MNKLFESLEANTNSGKFFERLFVHIAKKKYEQAPTIIEQLLGGPYSSLTDREKTLFESGYQLAVVHIFRGLNEHVAGFDFKSMPPEISEKDAATILSAKKVN